MFLTSCVKDQVHIKITKYYLANMSLIASYVHT